jgi:hypothetical protein
MSLIWGYHPQPVSAVAEIGAAQAARNAREAQRDAATAEQNVDRLTLICMAMWELVSAKTDLTEDDLVAKVREIDLRDGVEDGKLKIQANQCPQCDRMMSRRHSRCLYCGAEDLQATAFEPLL